MLKLFVSDKGGILKGSSVPIRWCVDQETIGNLTKQNIKNPYLLIVTVRNPTEETRQLVPLDQLMEYIQPRRSGNINIWAVIVWDEDGDVDSLKKKYVMREGNCYRTDLLTDEGELITGLKNSADIASVNVEIPSEIFAKKPFDWRWVNWWFEAKPVDQCHFRKRRLYAYTFKPLFAFVYVSILFIMRAAVILGLLACGFVKLNYKPIIHLDRDDTEDIYDPIQYGETRPIITLACNDKNPLPYYRHTFRFYFLQPLMPAFWIVIYIISYLEILKNKLAISPMLLTLYIVLALTSIWGLIDLLRFWAIRSGNLERKKEIKISEDWLSPDIMLCTKELLVARINNLPAKKRTIHLRYLDLKARVCKPFPN